MITRRLCRAAVLLASCALAATPLAAWTPVGSMPPPERQGDTLLFKNDRFTVAVSVLAPEIVRVRYAPGPALGRDFSYAVVRRDFGDPRAAFEVGPERSVITTSALRVTLEHAPFRVAFADARGVSLDADDRERGVVSVAGSVKAWKRLRDDEHVYGFGEKTGQLDKRGWKLGGYAYTMWNSDTYAYDASTDPIYASVPFYMVLRAGRAHGVFLDNTHRSHFDVGRELAGLLAFGAAGGELDYYFIDGPSPKQVLERYAALTGRMPLPPRWALGYHQCRYSYYPESRVRFIADNFRERRIPADVLWLDIHYQDAYKPFTWHPGRFPDPKKLIADLAAQGFRVVTIVDPHPKKEPGSPPYDTGLAGDHFVKNADGTVYEAPVWPAQAEQDPAPSVFPDFSRPATREWWGGLFAPFVDLGVAGIWNDMNEPAVFDTPTGTFPLDVRHDGDGAPTDHREIHNVYGLLNSRATYEGLARLRPGERPFVLTRATFAGGQRWAAVWPGDNVSRWADLGASLPLLLGMGLSGFPFVGVDVGGFAGAPSAELYTRWLQAAVFSPFLRTHTTFGTPDQEPWSYGTRHEEVNRRAIELRYRLLPHVYSEMRSASETGVPALRPLFLEFPEDPQTWGNDHQYLFGADLLVAPVLDEGAGERWVYLPAGDWYDFATGERRAGGGWNRVPVTLASLPIFVRAGAFVFQQPVVQHTGEMAGQPLVVSVYPAAISERRLYEDDGLTFAYRDGVFLERTFRQRRGDGEVVVEVGAASGSYRPPARDLELRIRWPGEPPRRVLLGDEELTDVETADGWVVVRLADRWDSLRVVLQGS